MNFARRVISGVGWGAATTAGTMVLRTVQMVLIARMLPPGEMGLYALANLALNFVGVFADAGLTQAIVARRVTSRAVLSSVCWTNLVVSATAAAAIVVAAPALAHLQGEPRLEAPLAWSAVTFVCFAATQPFLSLLQRELDFRATGLAELIGATVGAVGAVAMVHEGLGVMGLVFGQVLYAAVRGFVLWFYGRHLFSPDLHWRFGETWPFLRLGLYQMGDRVIGFVNARLDQLLIGSIAGAEALGIYALAWSLVVEPIYRLNPIVTNVAFPALAHKQDDKAALQRGFLLMTRALTTINAPIMLGIAATAPVCVPVLLGPEWQSAIPLMQVLAMVGLARGILNPTGALVAAVGRPDLSFRWTTRQSLIQLPLLAVALASFGLMPAAICLAVFTLGLIPFIYRGMVVPILGPIGGEYLGSMLPAVGMGLAMAIMVDTIAEMALPLAGTELFAVQVVCGAAFYAVGMLLLRPDDARFLRGLVGPKGAR